MTPPPFDWNSIAPGSKAAFSLPVTDEIALPVLAVRGAAAGPALVVSAGVHGDEFEGVQAIFDVYRWLDAAQLRGSLIAVPVANPPAFWNLTRTSPDGGNLARTFPGDPAGTATQAIAWCFDRGILSLADFYLDLHSAGVQWAMPTLVGYHAADRKAEAAAEAFGAPVVWRHPTVGPGRTVSAASARGIPWLYAEARGAGRIHAADLEIYRRGMVRLLRHLGILSGALEPLPPPVRLCGDGNIDRGIAASERGFLTPCVELLQEVETGQPLGTLQDVWGRTIQELTAPCGGVVVLIHACPLVKPGEPLFLLTDHLT